MPSGTGYKPARIQDFTSDKLLFSGTGVLGSAAFGKSSNIDYTLSDDMELSGVQLYAKGAVFGDNVTFQVLDTATGQYSGQVNRILNQFATNWYMRDDVQLQLNKDLPYPAKVLAGMVLRVVYNSVGSVLVAVAVNYDLHKVLV